MRSWHCSECRYWTRERRHREWNYTIQRLRMARRKGGCLFRRRSKKMPGGPVESLSQGPKIGRGPWPRWVHPQPGEFTQYNRCQLPSTVLWTEMSCLSLQLWCHTVLYCTQRGRWLKYSARQLAQAANEVSSRATCHAKPCHAARHLQRVGNQPPAQLDGAVSTVRKVTCAMLEQQATQGEPVFIVSFCFGHNPPQRTLSITQLHGPGPKTGQRCSGRART